MPGILGMRGRAGVDEDFFAFEDGPIHGDLVRARETGVAAVEMHLGALGDLLFLAVAGGEHDLVFLREDLREIDRDVPCDYAPAIGVAGVVGYLGAMHHGFCGRAAGVDAGAA